MRCSGRVVLHMYSEPRRSRTLQTDILHVLGMLGMTGMTGIMTD